MKNILVVSINDEMIEKIQGVLEPQGYEILTAGTPEASRDAVESKDREIQFVLYDADIAMHGGMDILLYLKDRYPELPVITATAMHKDTGPAHLMGKEKNEESKEKTSGPAEQPRE